MSAKVFLAEGMIFICLASDPDPRMSVLNADKPLAEKFQLYGDSAYVIMDNITSLPMKTHLVILRRV